MRHLRAGALTVTLDGPDLTHVRLGGVEIVRRILISVRDTNWDTLAPQVLRSSIASHAEHFKIGLEGQHVAGDIVFQWRATITGEASGRLRYELDGRAGSDFLYSRVGLCVLHPVGTCAGAAYRASAAGVAHEGVLAADITPQIVTDGVPIALFPACDALELMPPGGGTISFAFSGDLFEMEDQRNWTDDSFKTYCTPANLGGPHAATEGKAFRQTVDVGAAGFCAQDGESDAPIAVALRAPLLRSVPPLGLAMGADLEVPTAAEGAALRRLGLAHVRADLELGTQDLDAQLARAIEACTLVGAALELALHLEASDDAALAELAVALRAADVPLARVLTFHREASAESPTETTASELVALVRRRLGDLAPVGGGTNMDFAELNRRRPDPAAGEVIAWSANAQVHAADDASVMETLRGQAATVVSARSFSGACRLAVGPITLRQRFNPAAAGPPLPPAPGTPPAHVDPRQATPFCAAWTAGSIAELAAAGADSLTYFELAGPAGVVDDQAWFPVYDVFAALADLRGQALLRCEVSAPERVAVLATEERAVLSNLTPIHQNVVIDGPPWAARHVALEPYGVSVLRQAD
jgi:hypothetical protein